jgi:hypothetical protein
VTDKPKERDWDKEMREVDRLLARLPEADPNLVGGHAPTLKKSVPAVSGASHSLPAAGPTGLEWIGTWTRVGLGVLIGVGMTQWPYPHGCGPRLLFYLVGVGAVLAAGIWSSLSSWKRRLAVAHLLSQLLIIWGLVLGAREVLPRVGYARAQGVWLCPDVVPK